MAMDLQFSHWLNQLGGMPVAQPNGFPASNLGQLTPGAGMPPVGTGNAPMSMQRPQMGPPGAAPPVPPMGQPQQQAPLNPAQMGMLSQMLMRRTPAPQPQSAAAQAGLPGAGAMAGEIDPSQMGMLAQLFGRQFLGG